MNPEPAQYLLIIGAMKSGTSALFELLSQHPAICPSSVKEPEYFSHGQGHGLHVGRYEDLWDFDPGSHRYALEASTGYTKYPEEPGVPERIAEYGLRPRFIYVLRDPIARIASHVSYAAWGKHGAAVDFTAPNVVNTSRYAMQLDRYAAVFPRETILLLNHAHLQSDPGGVGRTVFDFLQLPLIDLQDSDGPKNAARPRSDWERRLMRSGRIARLAERAPSPVKSAFRRASGARSAPRPEMDEATESRLRDELRSDMSRLNEEWGFDVAGWGFGG